MPNFGGRRRGDCGAGRYTVGDSDGPRCNRIRGACKRGATRNTRLASSRRADHRRRQIPCIYLRWPVVVVVVPPGTVVVEWGGGGVVAVNRPAAQEPALQGRQVEVGAIWAAMVEDGVILHRVRAARPKASVVEVHAELARQVLHLKGQYASTRPSEAGGENKRTKLPKVK